MKLRLLTIMALLHLYPAGVLAKTERISAEKRHEERHNWLVGIINKTDDYTIAVKTTHPHGMLTSQNFTLDAFTRHPQKRSFKWSLFPSSDNLYYLGAQHMIFLKRTVIPQRGAECNNHIIAELYSGGSNIPFSGFSLYEVSEQKDDKTESTIHVEWRQSSRYPYAPEQSKDFALNILTPSFTPKINEPYLLIIEKGSKKDHINVSLIKVNDAFYTSLCGEQGCSQDS